MSVNTERSDTFQSLDKASEKALHVTNFNIKSDRYIIFSDVHKGDRESGSDDFIRNEKIYCYALAYYLENDFRLVLNGDIEDGWECKLDKIVSAYPDTYVLEKSFNSKPGYYIRIVGNHDEDWNNLSNVRKILLPLIGDVTVYPAVFLGDKIFITHGHQGDFHSDRNARFSRFIVKTGWKFLQHVLKLMNNSASRNNKIRNLRDLYLSDWASVNQVIIIAGHTHRGMFESYSKIDQLREIRENLLKKLKSNPALKDKYQILSSIDAVDQVIRESKEEIPEDKETARLDTSIPCYFNDGCCVHTDGITGIEIDAGTIRLVKWEITDTVCEDDGLTRDQDSFAIIQRKIYQYGNLEKILNQIYL